MKTIALESVDFFSKGMKLPDKTWGFRLDVKGGSDSIVNDIIDCILSALKKYGKCDEFAKILVDSLRENDIPYRIIRIDSKAGIYSDKAEMIIGIEYHYGIQVGDVVYDNMTPKGMKLAKWLEDLGLTLGIPDIEWNYVTQITNTGR